ncbi:MAG: hypothetical protein HKN70_07075 [Gammaproteobacteria bacterium]|nr:hypothetical protein [Gammaproteobacteria bacterium]
MIKHTSYLLGYAACLALTGAADAQIVAIEGSHDLSGTVSHRDVTPPISIWSNTFDQVLPVTTLGPSIHQYSMENSVFDSTLSMLSMWDANSESITGTVSKTGHISYSGWIGNNLHPQYVSHAVIDFRVDLEEAGTPFRLTLDWDMLPYDSTGDGWGYSTFIVYAGDDGSIINYGLIAGGSLDNVSPNLGPTGTFVFEGVSRRDNLRVSIQLYGPGDSQGNPGCDSMFCGYASVDQESFVNFELLVGDAAVPPDTDLDDITDELDNCLLVANADQHDSNADGFGNLCDPDLDNNGVVNFVDYSLLTTAFLATPASPGWNPDADLNNDGVVNFGDVALFPPFFLMPPGPSGTAP